MCRRYDHRVFLSVIILCIVICTNISSAAAYSFANACLRTYVARDIFIEAVPSKSTVFAGEVFTVKYVLCFSTDIIDPETDINVKFKNCYQETYPVEALADRFINGKKYHVKMLEKVLLVPQFEGSVTIPAITIELKINRPAASDNFFGTDRLVTEQFSSKPGQVKVLALPPAKGFASFSGAVGRLKLNYQFTASAKTPNLLKANITVSGLGQLKFAHWPIPALPPGMNIFDIKHRESANLTGNDLHITHRYTFDIVSDYQGDFIIPPIAFIVFDPDGAKYVKLETAAYHWQVNTGPPVPKYLAGDKIKKKGSPFLFVKTNLGTSRQLAWGSKTMLFLMICGVSCFIIGGIKLYKTKIEEKNPASHNFKTAKKRAIRKIKKLENSALNLEPPVFQKNLSEIMQTYICHKTGIALQEFSIEDINNKMSISDVPADTIVMFAGFINDLYKNRFSPVKIKNGDNRADCAQALSIIKQIDFYIR